MPASWLHLPPELRFEILNLVSKGDKKGDRTAAYATVCSEWQYFFEARTFRHLLIKDRDLHDFARILNGENTRRTSNVRHVLFLVVLPGYNCPSCHKYENWFEIYRNNRIFTSSMDIFLGILSKWEPRSRSDGITLELGIRSWSEGKHYYGEVTTHKDYPFRSWDNPGLHETIDMYSFDVSTAYERGGKGWLPPDYGAALTARRRYLGPLLKFEGLRSPQLPRVQVVSSLLIRQQFKRQMNPLALGKLVRESLVHITSFRLERWCRIIRADEAKYVQDFRDHVLASLPESVSSFHYFAENYKDRRQPLLAWVEPLSAMDIVRDYGHRFKEISVIEPSQTEHWPAKMQPLSVGLLTNPVSRQEWQKLERICFRSRILRHDNSSGLINSLLLSTAPVAQALPNLRSWEIFNTSQEYTCELASCLFRYSVEHLHATLLWESYWQLPPDDDARLPPAFEFYPEVTLAWEKAAVSHTGRRDMTIRVHEPKQEIESEFSLRQRFWPDYKPRLAEGFMLDAVHPFSRVLMRLGHNGHQG